MAASPSKVAWSGRLLGVQPRIDLTRSFDQRYHSYLGYLLRVEGEVDGALRSFTVRIGPGTQAKHAFRAGDRVSGAAHPAADPENEAADFLRTSAIKLDRKERPITKPPPWIGVPPALSVYRERGHRRLDARTFETSCLACQWGCRMAVTLIVDQWRPEVVRRRFEAFCYGPKSCPRYRAGPARKAPGRGGISYTEEDWIDEEATAHRGPND